MLRVLSAEESFAMMLQSFERLKQYDMIDLTHDDKRYPAVVCNIDRSEKAFEVIPLPGVARQVVDGKAFVVSSGSIKVDSVTISLVRVVLPKDKSGKHVLWNVLSVQDNLLPMAFAEEEGDSWDDGSAGAQ
jgi:hypothetical protein